MTSRNNAEGAEFILHVSEMFPRHVRHCREILIDLWEQLLPIIIEMTERPTEFWSSSHIEPNLSRKYEPNFYRVTQCIIMRSELDAWYLSGGSYLMEDILIAKRERVLLYRTQIAAIQHVREIRSPDAPSAVFWLSIIAVNYFRLPKEVTQLFIIEITSIFMI